MFLTKQTVMKIRHIRYIKKAKKTAQKNYKKNHKKRRKRNARKNNGSGYRRSNP